MIRGLAIETSGRLGSIAITDDGAVIGEDAFAHGLKHASEMIPRIDRLLKSVNWRPGELREIYVSAGPGSFTGLRIGLTLAKTLAFATGAAAVAVPTVNVLAYNAPPEARDVVIVLDAKRDQIFTARLHRADSASQWTVVEPAHLDSLADILSRSPRPVWLIGEGLPFHEKFLPRDDRTVIPADLDAWRARASVVAALGYRMARDGQFTDAQSLAPIYIRKPEAEEKYEAAHGGPASDVSR